MPPQPDRRLALPAFALRAMATALLLLLAGRPAHGQANSGFGTAAPLDFDSLRPVPVLSAGMGFISTFEGGEPHLGPLVAPVLLAPVGKRWLFESRATFESDLATVPGSNGFHGVVEKELDYAQVDFIASPYLTVTAGRYLVPFGIYNERLYPIWIRNLQSDPLILPLGTGPSGAGTGGMLRGGFPLNGRVDLNYAVYFSVLSTTERFDSARMAGGRAGIFIPAARLEAGASFQHLLQDERSNNFGFHFEWQPSSVPFDVRAEYARSALGSGYWIEPAFRLTNVSLWGGALSRIQLVARMQRFLPGDVTGGDLPSANTRLAEFGFNYYFQDDLRFTSDYGRQFSPAGNENVWTMGFTYRFVLPLGNGDIQ